MRKPRAVPYSVDMMESTAIVVLYLDVSLVSQKGHGDLSWQRCASKLYVARRESVVMSVLNVRPECETMPHILITRLPSATPQDFGGCYVIPFRVLSTTTCVFTTRAAKEGELSGTHIAHD